MRSQVVSMKNIPCNVIECLRTGSHPEIAENFIFKLNSSFNSHFHRNVVKIEISQNPQSLGLRDVFVFFLMLWWGTEISLSFQLRSNHSAFSALSSTETFQKLCLLCL